MSGKTYYSEDYRPMRERKLRKAHEKVLRDIKAYGKSVRGWGARKKIRAYGKQRQREYNELAWDGMIDTFTFWYIIRSNTDKDGLVRINVLVDYDDNGNITNYNIGDTEKGWERIKERAYNSYLSTHKDCITPKENVLEDILKEIEKRTPLILNLMKEKPRTRGIPAKVRYKVYMRDDGKCVFCGSNINIEFDHIIPFSKGGSHSIDNIRVLCQDCNRKRGNDIEKF